MIKSLLSLKSTVINSLFLLIAGTAIGGLGTLWIIQQNLDGVCSLVSARNQFVNIINKDSE